MALSFSRHLAVATYARQDRFGAKAIEGSEETSPSPVTTAASDDHALQGEGQRLAS